jgi:hypothetical protein
MFVRFKRAAVVISLTCCIGLAPFAGGCANLPGSKGAQGAVIGGLGGAAAGAIIGKKNRGVGALIGAAIGAGGGYLIGASQEKVDKKKTDEAKQASDRAAKSPASSDDVFKASTADLNNDGFVTLDEVVAMQQAGLTDREMIDRLQRTDQIFELTTTQQNYLHDRGISQRVIDAMLKMNQGDGTDTAADTARPVSDLQPSERISEPATAPATAPTRTDLY